MERPPAVIDLGDVAAEFLPVLRAAIGAGHALHFSRPPAIGQVLMDRTQFTRLLLNLVVNASEAMPEGGPVEISLSPVKLTGSPSYTGRFVLLEVSDRGAGMDESTRQRAFEPFFSTKAKGTGLGLAVVRNIAERAGGLVRIMSAPERGTTFRVLFPRIGASSGGTSLLDLPQEFARSDFP